MVLIFQDEEGENRAFEGGFILTLADAKLLSSVREEGGGGFLFGNLELSVCWGIIRVSRFSVRCNSLVWEVSPIFSYCKHFRRIIWAVMVFIHSFMRWSQSNWASSNRTRVQGRTILPFTPDWAATLQNLDWFLFMCYGSCHSSLWMELCGLSIFWCLLDFLNLSFSRPMKVLRFDDLGLEAASVFFSPIGVFIEVEYSWNILVTILWFWSSSFLRLLNCLSRDRTWQLENSGRTSYWSECPERKLRVLYDRDSSHDTCHAWENTFDNAIFLSVKRSTSTYDNKWTYSFSTTCSSFIYSDTTLSIPRDGS